MVCLICQTYQLCRKSTICIKCEGQDKCPNFQNHLINIIYLPPSTPCWAVSWSKILIHQSIFDSAYLNILKYFSHPCFFRRKKNSYFLCSTGICLRKKPPKNNFVSSSFRRLTHLYDAYFIIIISYVFYINTHLSMITVYEAIYFYVFQQCLDVEHQYIFLTGLVISVLSSWVSPWQSRFGF